MKHIQTRIQTLEYYNIVDQMMCVLIVEEYSALFQEQQINQHWRSLATAVGDRWYPYDMVPIRLFDLKKKGYRI